MLTKVSLSCSNCTPSESCSDISCSDHANWKLEKGASKTSECYCHYDKCEPGTGSSGHSQSGKHLSYILLPIIAYFVFTFDTNVWIDFSIVKTIIYFKKNYQKWEPFQINWLNLDILCMSKDKRTLIGLNSLREQDLIYKHLYSVCLMIVALDQTYVASFNNCGVFKIVCGAHSKQCAKRSATKHFKNAR